MHFGWEEWRNRRFRLSLSVIGGVVRVNRNAYTGVIFEKIRRKKITRAPHNTGTLKPEQIGRIL